MTASYDLAIIGGGPGGYTAAIRGAQQGLRVILVEKCTLGGTCLTRGCIPTKSLIHDTKLLMAARESPVMTGSQSLTIDPVKMIKRKRSVVDGLLDGLQKIIQSHRIALLQGTGELVSAGRVRVHLQDATLREYRIPNVILATGSRPWIPPALDVDGCFVQTTDEALDSADIPAKVILIGGGVIGMEMAAIYLNLGSKVTIIEMLPDILLSEDHEIRRAVKILLAQRGARLYLESTVKKISLTRGRAEVRFEDASGRHQRLHADRVLVATGRQPVMRGIDTKQLGLEKNGPFIKVNGHMATNLPGVYAVGDVVGGLMLAHKAFAEAEIAIANIAGAKKTLKPELIPRCIWTLAEIGAVGLTEEAARATGQPIRIGRFSFANSAAATAREDIAGFTKIVGHAQTGEILGVHIMGERATELVGEAVLAKTMEAAVEDLAAAVHPHPTLSETVMEAALDWNHLAIHSLKQRQ